MIEKRQDIRLPENKIRDCEQNRNKLKFTSLTISPGTAAVMWPLIMNLLTVRLWSVRRKSLIHFDRAPYMATYFSQNIAPLQSGFTGQYVRLSSEPTLEFPIVACLCFNAVTSSTPVCLSDLLQLYFPS